MMAKFGMALVLVLASATAVPAQQSYEISRPYGDRGPAYVTGPNGSSPSGRHGPWYYGDNNRQPYLNPLLPPSPRSHCEQPWQNLWCSR
jgi:hypothetical protein